MVEEGRRFECRQCGAEVWVCRHCDRGQCHCSPACRLEARRHCAREAGKRYQETEAGRLGNARRQREWYWRECSSEKVGGNLTHQGSIGSEIAGIIPPAAAGTELVVSESTEPVDTKTVESPASEVAVAAAELPSDPSRPRCHVCRRLIENRNPRSP